MGKSILAGKILLKECCTAGSAIVLFPGDFSAILSKQEISPAGVSGTCARSLSGAGFQPVHILCPGG